MKPLTRIQKFAKGKQCLLRIPGVCQTTPNNEDVVLAHAPYPGRGGTRLHDWWGCPACMKCHDLVDSRDGDPPNIMVNLNYEVYWMPAIHEWQVMLMHVGLLNIGEKK